MSNIFESVLNGDMDEELFTEAVFPDRIPKLRTLSKQVFLPQGTPVGKGNLCFLYTNSFKDSMELMTSPKNFQSKNKYYYYYYQRDYIGHVLGKKYRFRDQEIRKNYYQEIKKTTKLTPIMNSSVLTNNRNMFVDLHRFITIFESICPTKQQVRYLNEYWKFMREILEMEILNSNEDSMYPNKFVLIDINKFSSGRTWKENMKNPLYLIYYGFFRKILSLVGDGKNIKPLDIDFYFFSGKKVLILNPSELVESNDPAIIRKLRVEMLRLMKDVVKKEDIELATDPKEIMKDDIKDEAMIKTTSVLDVIDNDITITSDSDIRANKVVANQKETIKKEIEKKVDDKVSKIKDITDNTDTAKQNASDAVANDVKKEIEADRKMIEKIYNETRAQLPKKSDISTARDKMLREAQKDINIDGMTIKDITKIKTNNVPIPVHDVSKAVTTTNENMKKLRFENLDKTYNEKVMKKDIINAFMSLNDKSIPIFIRDIKVEDTSDELNYKDTYTVMLEDGNRKRQTIKVDIPKFIDNKFLYIGGNKKIVKHQNFYFPVVKISPSMVQVVSNYSKTTIERVDNKSISSIERLKKFVNKNEEIAKYFTMGNNVSSNKDVVTTIEYDDLSKVYTEFKCAKTYFMFNQEKVQEYMKKNNIPEKKNKLYIGKYKGEDCYIDYNTQESQDNYTITEMIVDSIPEDLSEEYYRTKSPKKLMFAKVRMMAQFVNVGMLLGMWEGISTILKKMKVEYRLEDKISSAYKSDEDFIKFKDCILVYKQTVPNAMILNGIKSFDTASYNLAEFDERTPYIDYVRKVYGRSIIENAIMNFYEFFIDSITLEICQDQNLPTDIVGLMIYAVNLLADSQYIPNINQNLSRVRQGEIIPAILYEKIAKNYVPYRNSNGRKKYSVPQDCVIKDILSLKTCEDYSTLNPTLELLQTHAISPKGFNGVNLDEAYTIPRRAYDPSMIGVISPGTPPDGNVGVAKYLSMEPEITNLRGYTEDKHEKLNELKDVNIFSPAELSLPGAEVDDPNRLG